jgi:hypothetical protein
MNGYMTRRADLDAKIRQSMYDLLVEHFDGVTEATFVRDLAEKNWVVLVEDDAGQLCGFSTLLYYRTVYRGRTIGVVCSGDTIVRQEARLSRALLVAWINSALWLARDLNPGDLYWLLISSGYRTYRCLPVAFREYFPACAGVAPLGLSQLADHLARQRWGDAYDPAAGLVRFAEPQRLRAEVSPLTNRLLQDCHISFFTQLNPGHRAGDELVCLTPLAMENLTSVGRRLLSPENACIYRYQGAVA